MPLDVAPLVNAIDRLREGLARHEREPNDERRSSDSHLRYKVDAIDLRTINRAIRVLIELEMIGWRSESGSGRKALRTAESGQLAPRAIR